MYTYSSKDEQEYSVLPEGDYECLIEETIMGKTSEGNDYIRVVLRVRDDVEQQGKNRTVSDFIRKSADGITYDYKKIHKYLKAVNTVDGTTFETIDNILDAIKGQYVIAHFRINEWNGKQNNQVYFLKPTEHPNKSGFSTASKEKHQEVPEDLDSLPF